MPAYLRRLPPPPRRPSLPPRRARWVPSGYRPIEADAAITQAAQTLTSTAEVDLLGVGALTQGVQIMLSAGAVGDAAALLLPASLVRITGQASRGMVALAIKAGATLASLPLTLVHLTEAGEVAADLTNAGAIVVRLHRTGTRDATIALPMTTPAAALGQINIATPVLVTYPLGLYDTEVVVTWASGTIEKFPSDGFFTIKVGETL